MNLARTCLETAHPDTTYTRAQQEKLAAAGLLGWLEILMKNLEEQGESFVPPGTSVIDAAVKLEELQMAQFVEWREELAKKAGNSALRKVELVFVELSTPQAVTVHERVDNSYAIALDRRMTTFLGAVTRWAYMAKGLELHGRNPLEARVVFLDMLSKHVLATYTKQPLPQGIEERELSLDRSLDQLDRRLLRDAAALAAKFVLFHELGHVHLGHFEGDQASQAAGAKTAQTSTFSEHNIEFAADAFANENLMDKEGGLAAAVASKVAPLIYLFILAMKEAMLPAADASVKNRAHAHPPYVERAHRLALSELPPAYLEQWKIYFQVPELLQLIYMSSSFHAAARVFASHTV